MVPAGALITPRPLAKAARTLRPGSPAPPKLRKRDGAAAATKALKRLARLEAGAGALVGARPSLSPLRAAVPAATGAPLRVAVPEVVPTKQTAAATRAALARLAPRAVSLRSRAGLAAILAAFLASPGMVAIQAAIRAPFQRVREGVAPLAPLKLASPPRGLRRAKEPGPAGLFSGYLGEFIPDVRPSKGVLIYGRRTGFRQAMRRLKRRILRSYER